VRGSGRRILTDLVSLVRFATETEGVLRPFNDTVKERFLNWLKEQEQQGRSFTEEQRLWLDAMADHIGASVSISADDFDETPFAQKGGLARAHRLFGEKLPDLLDELNLRLVA
jgi:type I restriction enzyme R subunit